MANAQYHDILRGASDQLQMLWRKRDAALHFEKENDITPRTSQKYIKAQSEIDEYMIPKKKKAQRKKPKKKVYIPDDGWAY